MQRQQGIIAMKKTVLMLMLLLAGNSAFAADKALGKSASIRFVKDFYDTLKSRDDKKLDTLIADNAVIKLRLLKMEQGFTFDKNDYLQQVKANWHFGKQDSYDLKDLSYTLTQAGLSATVSFKMTESRFILGETVSQDETVEIGLTLVDDQLKISSIKAQTTF
jgi:hypothetical protein